MAAKSNKEEMREAFTEMINGMRRCAHLVCEKEFSQWAKKQKSANGEEKPKKKKKESKKKEEGESKKRAREEPAEEEDENWECEGNLLSDEPCPLTKENQQRAARTRHNKKFHMTCKQCKKDMEKMRKKAKKEEGEAKKEEDGDVGKSE
jgi:hypothetical protein